MDIVTKDVLAECVLVGPPAQNGEVKTNSIVQRVTRTFLEFLPPRELAAAHGTTLHGGRSRADSDSSIQYGEYGNAGQTTPCRSTLTPTGSFAGSDSDCTWPNAVEDWPAAVEEWPTFVEESPAVVEEIITTPWCDIQAGGHYNVHSELCNDAVPLQHMYCLPMLFQVSSQGSQWSDAYTMNQLMSQAQEANEFAAHLKMQAAQLRAEVRHAEEQGIKERAPWNRHKKFDCNVGSSAKTASTSWPPVNDTVADNCPLPGSSDDIVASQWPETRRRYRRGPFSVHFKSDVEASKNSKLPTTLMLRNIPNGYTRESLLGHFAEFGLQDCVDFIYVPMDFHRAAGLGYAFANFSSNTDAERAREMFEGFCSWGAKCKCTKICEVSFSYPLQGLDDHLEHYRNSCVMHESVPDSFKPAVYENGTRQPFPQPTKQIPLPRMKRQF